MGRAPCCEKSGLRKGLWSPEEDEKLYNYILKHGHSNWRTLPKNAGLARCGKSCRLRWTNYLRPDLKRGCFSFEEEETIIQLHSILGNKWSAIAARLPGRTDNEIKNYWNTRKMRKRLLRTDIHNLQGGSSSSYLEVEEQIQNLRVFKFTGSPSPIYDPFEETGYFVSSYLEVEDTGSIVSSSSGTIVSTTYTSNVSRPSTVSMETAMHFVSLGIHEDVNGNNVQVCEEAGEERIRSLVQEFFSAPSANCSIKVGDMSVVERWLKELGVGWVLSLDGGAAVGEEFDRDARTWIRALGHIAQTFCLMWPLFPDPESVGLPNLCQREEEHVGERRVPDRYHLAVFILETMSKILNFVDVIVARDPDMTEEFLSMDQVMPPPYNKLITLLGVHDALSKVSYKILTQINWSTSVEGRRIESEMGSLLSECKRKLGEAISSTIEKIRTMLMEDGEDSSSPLNPQGSSDIHKVTRSVMRYIGFLKNSSLLVNAVIQGHVPYTENIKPVDSMTVEMVSSLQEKLVNISESFSDQGLRFLFLLNNSYHIQQRFHFRNYRGPMSLADDLSHKIEGYMERYLQVSWAPLLSCLFNPTPLCFGKIYSPLSKFESEFQEIYTTQKQWKVPDPELRGRLRGLITDKIIPGYTKYIEDNKVTNPKISPQELKAMLQELFEG